MGKTKFLSLGSYLQIDGADSVRYKIIGRLGQGAYGSTFMATVQILTSIGTVLDTEYVVAVKEIDMPESHGHYNPQVKCNGGGKSFDEFKLIRLSGMQHPNIVRYYDMSYRPADNTAFCVMEYINGKTLDDYIAMNNELSEEEAVRITKQIGEALTYLHSNGILHLDLKPSNIMVKESGDIVVIDFGLCKVDSFDGRQQEDRLVGEGILAGTPGYAPLEQTHCVNREVFPVTMDVYALGATMYKMLTGVRPPEAIDIMNDGFPLYVLQRHHVSDAVSKSIAIAMAPEKGKRYDSVARFIQSLEEEKPFFDMKIATGEKKKPLILDGRFVVPENIQRVTVEFHQGRVYRGYYGTMNKEIVKIATSPMPDATCRYRKMTDGQFYMFLRDLRSLNLQIRPEITPRCDSYSEVSPLFSLALYDESNDMIYKYWISGWNDEEGNIDGDIYDIERKIRRVFPLLQEMTEFKID